MANLKTAAENLERRGYAVRVFQTKEEAAAYLDGAIDGVSVGFGGSMTLKELGLCEKLSAHNTVHWHWIDGPEARRAAMDADVYLSSANGLTEAGEIINIDGAGNRVAGTLYGHKKVYFVIGRNKLAPTFEEALHRARNVAAPKNALRFDIRTPCKISGGEKCFDCKSPDRICRALVVLWGPMMNMETEVVLVDEDLGY